MRRENRPRVSLSPCVAEVSQTSHGDRLIGRPDLRLPTADSLVSTDSEKV
jgi:hypothetical protein